MLYQAITMAKFSHISIALACIGILAVTFFVNQADANINCYTPALDDGYWLLRDSEIQ